VSFHSAALHTGEATAATLSTPSRSTNIALTRNDRQLVVVNRETNSVSIIRVRNAQGQDIANKIAEIAVGIEPRCVAVSPNDDEAFVTNGISGTVSVINLNRLRVVAEMPVGPEPRGCALTPNGQWLFVANHTAGTVSIIRTASRTVVGTVSLPPPNRATTSFTLVGTSADFTLSVLIRRV
jgi:YVTN family beta-propeller protein